MNEQLKLTPIDQIEDMADGVPVLAVEGTVKYAGDITSGPMKKRNPTDSDRFWTKQFFVLTNGTAEIACSMWNAEGNEISKGETVHIENTQNKKGVWSGMIKGSYQKNGERKHTLEIRASQVKIQTLHDEHGIAEVEESGGGSTFKKVARTAKTSDIPKSLPYDPHARIEDGKPIDPDWPEAPATAPESSVQRPNGDSGVMEARKHLMKACNLYNLCIKAAVTAICPNIPDEQRTNDQFQSTLASLWIEASSRRSTDGKTWWSFIDRMPDKPLDK